MAIALGLAVDANARSAKDDREYSVKASFLLNFARFVQWPPAAFDGPRSPLTICVLGADPFEGALNHVAQGQPAKGRKVSVQRLSRPPAPKACQVVFLAAGENESKQLRAEFGPGVLTVGEGDEFLAGGGMIAFVLENNRVRFDVNQPAMAAAGLTASSRMLSVARVVHK